MSAEIVSFEERRQRISDPALVQVEAYWEGLRSGRVAPTRAEIDPRGLAGVLPHCFILERIAPGLARFRVVGRTACDLMGIELQGMPLSVMFFSESRDVLEDAVERVFSRPAISRLTIRAPKGFGREEMQGQMMLLPLRDDMGQVTRILGAITMAGKPGRTPRRLEIDAVTPREIPEGAPMAVTRAAPEARTAGGGDNPAEIIRLPLPAD